MGISYAKESLDYMKEELLRAWKAGQDEIIFRVSDIKKAKGWRDGQSAISGVLLELCGKFKEAGGDYSYYAEDFPVFETSITNLRGPNLAVRFRFPLDRDLKKVLELNKRGIRKSIEKEFVAERIRREGKDSEILV